MKYVVLATAGFIIMDMLTGIIKAFKEKAFTSSVMREGLFHKCGSVLTIMFGVLVDYVQQHIDIGVNVPVATSFCVYIILMECGSIIENIGKINPEILPAKLCEHFTKLKKG
ncbi:MAG: phage holin family protein [Clostridia bacterium]|nr:phage holin family protein [Clostridia bacterium]